MAGDWIKIESTSPDKPEVFAIAARLSIDPDSVVGKLVRLWAWVDSQSLDGNAVSVTNVTLDRITFCKGFAEALRSVGWLTGEDGALSFPNFARHNGKTAKARAVTGKRVSNHRSICNAATVTNVTPPPLPEKRREDIERGGEADEGAKAKNQPTRPTLAQAKSAAGNAGVTDKEAEEWWLKRESSGWMKGTGGGGTTPVGSNWQADLKQFVNGERERKASNKPPNGKTGQNSSASRRVDRNAGTLNDPSEYAGL